MTRAVFLDRDGVINRKPPEDQYVTCWEDFHMLPDAVEGIRLLNQAGFCVIVITNQRCIAKGIMTVADLENLHQQMSDSLARGGATIDGIYYCPHEVEPPCRCRKPAPGMLFDAASSRGIELPASWMIGDSDIDIEAGRSAGCKTARLLTPKESSEESGSRIAASSVADIVAPSLIDAVCQILHGEAAASSFTIAPGHTQTRSRRTVAPRSIRHLKNKH
jgi:D-glycero-D-manno-heptose 1,7-bisphosphate phosphatase